MLIMECRYIFLQKLAAALDKIQIPLVGFDGTKFVPFLTCDDIGLYIFVPKIMHFLQISLDQAIDLFFYFQLSVAFMVALVGFFLLFKSVQSILFSLISFTVFLRFITYALIFDVYIEYLVSAFCIIPLFLYFILKNKESHFFNYFMVFSGMIIGFSHYVRSYSSLPVLGFILCMALLNQQLAILKKVILLGCLLLGIGISTLYFKITIQKYQNFAKNHFGIEHLHTKHVFWYPIYLGFGLLKILNKDDITWDDSFGEKKVKEKMPGISSVQIAEYEHILKNEVFELVKHQRGFVLWTIFAKLGILFMYFILFANIGLLAFCCFYRRWDLDLAFLCAFALSSITPLLTLPYYCYALSFIAFAFLFGLFYTNTFLEHQKISYFVQIKNRFFMQKTS